MDVDSLVACYPKLYHMAERNTWPSIKANGLLSTSAALNQLGIRGAQRRELEQEHRPEKVPIGPAGQQIVLRDQKPMPPERIADALIDGTTPQQWYEFLNGRVFMWAEEKRLHGLLNARPYRKLEHDVLTIDTASLMADYGLRTWLCRLNSGNTWPMPHPRGMDDFKRIDAYPMKARVAKPQKAVVEVVVDDAIPDIAKYVIEVRRMKGKVVLRTLPL
jgi:hypothetical protein